MVAHLLGHDILYMHTDMRMLFYNFLVVDITRIGALRDHKPWNPAVLNFYSKPKTCEN